MVQKNKNKRQRAGGARNRIIKSARKVAGMDPDDPQHIDELRKHFAKRDEYVARDKHVDDFVELTPMSLGGKPRECDVAGTGDSLLSKRERATAKGRKIEADRRNNKREASVSWNGGVAQRMRAETVGE